MQSVLRRGRSAKLERKLKTRRSLLVVDRTRGVRHRDLRELEELFEARGPAGRHRVVQVLLLPRCILLLLPRKERQRSASRQRICEIFLRSFVRSLGVVDVLPGRRPQPRGPLDHPGRGGVR